MTFMSTEETQVGGTRPTSLCLRADIWLFRQIKAGQGPVWLLHLAKLIARHSWLVLLAVIAWTALYHDHGLPLAAAALTYAGLLQLAGKRLAQRWQSQRPFVLGLCENHLRHSARAGFPSSHALVMGAVVGAMIPVANDMAILLMVGIAVTTGWARVHTAAHFPSDVLAGLVVGGLLGWLPGTFLTCHFAR